MIDRAKEFDVAVLGGGASGIVAAISAKRAGKAVIICERLPRLGKKILASGNGRCNLLNENLSETFYNPQARTLIKSVLLKFGKEDILDFFKGLGLETYSEEGRIFPMTNQSSSVLQLLEIELKKLSIPVELNFETIKIAHASGKFILESKSGHKVSAKTMIIALGGRSYPALGSDGASYKFAGQFGHTIVEPVPSAVALITKDPLCHILQGQKISAYAKVVIGSKVVNEASGEVLFTKYGLSGTAILDISREVSIAINRLGNKSVKVSVDMVPFIDESKLKTEIEGRLKKNFPSEDLMTGILPNKFNLALADLLKTRDPAGIARNIKNREFNITGTRGWNEADFTAGGIDTREINPETLESKLKEDLYFTGEALDVDGCRGGYNLAWAWASGFIAGANA